MGKYFRVEYYKVLIQNVLDREYNEEYLLHLRVGNYEKYCLSFGAA
mgnify:CR=1 FL=1